MAIELSDEVLLLRADDHIVLGLRWWGMHPITEGPGPARLRVGAEGGGMVLGLPPQHLAEGATQDPPAVVRLSALAGSSALAIELTVGTEVTLTVEGVLRASSTGRLLGRGLGDGRPATAIELPYGLRFAPESSAGAVVLAAPARPVGSGSGTIGLWLARVVGRDLRLTGLENRPGRAGETVGPPLDRTTRQAVVDSASSSGAPPIAERIHLSCLGGSLMAHGGWDSLDWTHEAALGRDHHVRVVTTGMLFPLGQRAVFVEATDRQVEDDGVGPVALLRTTRTLLVTEPVRDLVVGDDPRLDRAFPFDTAVTPVTTFTSLGAPAERRYVPPTPDLAAKRAELVEHVAVRDGLLLVVAPEQVRDRDVGELSIAEAGELMGLEAELASLGTQLGEAQDLEARAGELAAVIDDLDRQVRAIEASNPQLPEGGFPSDVQTTLDELGRQISAAHAELSGLGAPGPAFVASLQAQIATRQARVDVIAPIVHLEQVRDRSVEEVAAAGGAAAAEAMEVLRLIGEIARLEQQIRAVEAAATDTREWILGLRTADGQPLRIPVELRSPGRPDLRLEVPAVFVADFSLPGDDFFPPFHSTTDASVVAAVDEVFSTLRHLPVPAAMVDLVRAPTPMPADQVEVHELTLSGVAHAGRFVPVIDELRVAVPALRALLGPEAQGAVRRFAPTLELLQRGPEAEVVLGLVVDELGDAIDVDFRAQTQVSGGVLAPRFLADGISRLHGPVSVAGLVSGTAPGRLDPREVLAEGASLLGLDLRELIGQLGAPPSIVQTVVDGRPPTVEMTWTGVGLQDLAPFVARSPSGGQARLDLTVETSPLGTRTECTVTDFALHFPPGDAAVLQVSFGQVKFLQRLGRDPTLELAGVAAEFVGDLRLLKEVGSLIDLGGSGLVVTPSTSGLTARYELAVPAAGAGVFQLRNIAVVVALDVPFAPTAEDRVTLTIGFASRRSPFNLSVLLFGGGGYLEVVLDREGARRLELSLEFGASTSISFAVATAEVHALGGVRALVGPAEVTIVGFLRFGGSVELLGLVSVSVELLVELRYEPPPLNRLVGQATLVIEVDLTLYSDSFELDSGEWVLVGSGGVLEDAVEVADDGSEEWRRYREAFELEDVS